jgi:hypothetical protein
MIIRDLARYDLNTVVQPGGMSRTDLNLSLRHQCLLRGASEHLWSLKYSSRKFSWGPAQSLYISLHLSTFSRVDSSLLFQIHASWCNSHVSLSGLQLQTRCRPKKQLRACATSSNDATSHECWTLSHMEELEALLAQVQSLTQRVLSLEELRMPSMWPDSTRFRSEPIWQEDKHRSERRMTERPCKGEV